MATLHSPTYFYNQDGSEWIGDGGYVGWGGYPASNNTFPNLGGNCTRIVRYTLDTYDYEHSSTVKIELDSHMSSAIEPAIKWAGGTSQVDEHYEILDALSGGGDSIDLYFLIGTDEAEHIGAGRDYSIVKNWTDEERKKHKVYIDVDHVQGTDDEKLENLRFHIEFTADYAIEPKKTYFIWIFPGYGYGEACGLFRWDDRESEDYKLARTVTLTDAHSYTSKVTAPTCITQGYTTYTCSSCGYSWDGDYTAALGHSPGAAATCTTAQTCTICGSVVTKALGHSYKSVITYPTCTDRGYTTHACSRCTDVYVDSYTDATGHTWEGATCTTCGASNAVVYIHNGSEFIPYQVYIYTGSGWELHEAYIYNGASWDPCG